MNEQFDDKHTESDKPSLIKILYAVIMVIVYIGMGVLMLINFFHWGADWSFVRYVLGSVLVVYGAWRAVRMIRFE